MESCRCRQGTLTSCASAPGSPGLKKARSPMLLEAASGTAYGWSFSRTTYALVTTSFDGSTISTNGSA